MNIGLFARLRKSGSFDTRFLGVTDCGAVKYRLSPMNLNLEGKRALVCGASQGIGEASALQLASMGASCVVLARSEDKLQSLVSRLPKASSSQTHSVITVDVHNRSELRAKVELELKKAPIEILICNSGGPKGGPIVEAEEKTFLDAFENHILANQLLVQLCLPGMRQKNYGRVINIISTSVKVPIPNLGVSNTIRAAVASWAKTLSLELAPQGITVNNVLPGYTTTPRLESLIKAAADKTSQTLDATKEQWRKSVPMQRFGTPAEIAAAVGFFASPAASYVTGTSLSVDGGRTGAL